MPSLPVLGGRDVVRALRNEGWQEVRQRGSHIILIKSGHVATLSIPDHGEVAKGTLRSIIRASGMTIEEFLGLLS